MNIVVCVKPVPDREKMYVDKKKGVLVRNGADMVINELDYYALELGLRCKDMQKDFNVLVLSMANHNCINLIRSLYGYGVDDAVLLSDKAFQGSDTLATSYVLSCGIRKIGECKIILCGCESSDGCTAQVGPNLAQRLGMKLLANVLSIQYVDEKKIQVQQIDYQGIKIVEASLPVVITAVSSELKIRTKKIKFILEAQNKDVSVWNAQDIHADCAQCGLSGSATQVKSMHVKVGIQTGVMIDGDQEEKVEQFISYLKKWKGM